MLTWWVGESQGLSPCLLDGRSLSRLGTTADSLSALYSQCDVRLQNGNFETDGCSNTCCSANPPGRITRSDAVSLERVYDTVMLDPALYSNPPLGPENFLMSPEDMATQPECQ